MWYSLRRALCPIRDELMQHFTAVASPHRRFPELQTVSPPSPFPSQDLAKVFLVPKVDVFPPLRVTAQHLQQRMSIELVDRLDGLYVRSADTLSVSASVVPQLDVHAKLCGQLESWVAGRVGRCLQPSRQERHRTRK
ncbi:hypothetical protein A4X13_0g9256 [Tilletia indica]|uniref:Uncharacterized protein n=1 Tax=Tilletia indica TaxID=43049 RepID=A0A8T8SAJ4_9BASI|nr:hypothetical protein A4X13_0g9256 [Tilletia indica]